ncbi:MAG: acyl-CoA desaturase [Bacteroidota bacterium]
MSSIKTSETFDSIYLKRRYRTIGILTFLLPFAGTLFTLYLLVMDRGVDTFFVVFLIVMYFLSVFGLEVGYHRYLSHNAFQTSKTFRVILTILGGMAASGPPIYWAATHRLHHKYSDKEKDPHSPHLFGDRLSDKLKGAWHAHIGWMINGQITNSVLLGKNLAKDATMRALERLYPFWILLGLVISATVGFIYTGDFKGMLLGFFWGGPVRIFFVHLLYIGGLNSICHTFGVRDFKTNDQSRNTWWMALPTLGQGWHNNHHAFPHSAIVGIKWWQIDISGYIILLLKHSGLVWNVLEPDI